MDPHTFSYAYIHTRTFTTHVYTCKKKKPRMPNKDIWQISKREKKRGALKSSQTKPQNQTSPEEKDLSFQMTGTHQLPSTMLENRLQYSTSPWRFRAPGTKKVLEVSRKKHAGYMHKPEWYRTKLGIRKHAAKPSKSWRKMNPNLVISNQTMDQLWRRGK